MRIHFCDSFTCKIVLLWNWKFFFQWKCNLLSPGDPQRVGVRGYGRWQERVSGVTLALQSSSWDNDGRIGIKAFQRRS